MPTESIYAANSGQWNANNGSFAAASSEALTVGHMTPAKGSLTAWHAAFSWVGTAMTDGSRVGAHILSAHLFSNKRFQDGTSHPWLVNVSRLSSWPGTTPQSFSPAVTMGSFLSDEAIGYTIRNLMPHWQSVADGTVQPWIGLHGSYPASTNSYITVASHTAVISVRPYIQWTYVFAPAAPGAFTSPGEATVVQGTHQVTHGTSSGQNIVYEVQISRDNGLNWEPFLPSASTTSRTGNFSAIVSSSMMRLRVRAIESSTLQSPWTLSKIFTVNGLPHEGSTIERLENGVWVPKTLQRRIYGEWVDHKIEKIEEP